MASAVVCILIATVDVICTSIVSQMLRHCSYEEVYSGMSPVDALTAVCAAKTRLKIVLTNMNRIDSHVARDALNRIGQKFHLHTFFMSPNDKRFELTGREADGTFAAYIINSFNGNSLSEFWNASSVSVSEVPRAIAMTSQQMVSWNPKEGASSSSSAAAAALPAGEGGKKKLIWTDELDRKFLGAIHSKDPKVPNISNITPSEILKLMKVPWLTRKQVGSHLQKYRLRVKKQQAAPKTTDPPSAPRQEELHPYNTPARENQISTYEGFKTLSATSSQVLHTSYHY